MTFDAFKDPNDISPTTRLISLILQGAEVEDYEPRVLAQLYEVAYSYILNTLQDAQLFADHAQHKEVTVSDIKLAIETRSALDFTNPPSRQALQQLAQKKNSIPLPLVPEKFGLRLPLERHCLIKNNISINPKKRPVSEMDIDIGSSPAPQSSGPPQPLPSQPVPLHKPAPMAKTMVSSISAQPAKAVDVDDDYDMDGNISY